MSGKGYAGRMVSVTIHLTPEQRDDFEQQALAVRMSKHDFFVDSLEGYKRGLGVAKATARTQLEQEQARLQREHEPRVQEQQMTFPCLVCTIGVRANEHSMEFLSQHRGHAGCMALY